MVATNLEGAIASLSPKKLALFVQKLRDQARKRNSSRGILKRERLNLARATPVQEQLWLLDRLYPSLSVYNVPVLIRLRQAVDLGALDAAFQELVRRHESLRTVFSEVDGIVWQKILPSANAELGYLDLSGFPPTVRLAAAQRELDHEAAAPFVLSQYPLVRITVLRLEDMDWLIAATFHHIITDAWSVSVFTGELRALLDAFMSGRPAQLPELEIQYGDYSEWLQSPERQLDRERQLAYWQQKLAGAAAPARFLPDYHSHGAANFSGSLEYFSLDASLTRVVKGFLPQSTAFMVFLAAFFVFLHRFLGERDIIIGSPVADRRWPATQPLIGLFLNFLLFRTQVSGQMTFKEVLNDIRKVVTEALDNQDVTPQEVLRALRLDRLPAFNAAYHINFGVQSEVSVDGGVPTEGYAVGTGTAKFDFSLVLAESASGYAGVVEYRTNVFKRETVRAILSAYKALLSAALAAPETPIAHLPLYSEEEKQSLLEKSAGQEPNTYDQSLFIERFAAWAMAQPDAPAIQGEETLSYRNLDRASDALALQLWSKGLSSGDVVVVLLERSVEWATAFLGILKAGGVYLSVNPNYPDERIEYLLRDSRARFAIAPPHFKSTSLEAIERIAPPELKFAEGELFSMRKVQGFDAAYAIYTSGTTGPPKAALLSHSGLAGLAAAQTAVFAPGPGDRVLSLSALSFDASIFELSMALAHGAVLCIEPAEQLLPGPQLRDTLSRTQTTILTAPPSILSLVPEVSLPDLRLVVAAGEPCPAALVRRWRPGRRFFNAYGPTECTVWATVHECSLDEVEPPIGRAIPGVRVYLLDDYGNLCPEGAVGEIAIGGALVGLGYLNRPGITGERFRTDPFAVTPGAQMFVTGDRGRMHSGGTIQFLGRADRQIKVRGFRIEPGEIEHALGRVSGIGQAAVFAESAGTADARLVAYVVASEKLDVAAVRRSLLNILPPFLVPERIHLVKEIPHTANGKVDYIALRSLSGEEATLNSVGEPLSGEMEERLAEIWREVLQVPKAFANSDFFLLGGHSLLVGRLLIEIRAAFGVDLTLKDVFNAPELRSMAAFISGQSPADTELAPVKATNRIRVSAGQLRSKSGKIRRSPV